MIITKCPQWIGGVFLYFLGKLAPGYLCKLKLTTVQSGFKWWGENPEKAPNPARQLLSLVVIGGHWSGVWSTGRLPPLTV